MAAVHRRLKRIEVYCPEYETTATIRINDAHSSGTDHLEVDYRSPDHSHFTIAIPDDWTDRDLLELIFLPPRDPGPQNWPAWEIPAYRFVSFKLFRFWKGEEITEDEFHREFNVNVLGTILATREAVKHFGPNGGSIINISSIASAGEAQAAIYSGTKGAVDSITRALSAARLARVAIAARCAWLVVSCTLRIASAMPVSSWLGLEPAR